MSILPVSSSITSSYDSTEVQNLKLKAEKEALSQKNENIIDKAAVESKGIKTKSEVSFEDSSAVKISLNGDSIEISKQGMSKAQGMSAAQNSELTKQSASTDTESSSTAYLSNDSNYELKQKLVKGSITQSQYDNEIKKRGKDTESAEVDHSTNQNK